MLRRFLVMVGGSLLCWGCNADTFTGDDGAPPDSSTNDVTVTEGGGPEGGKGDGGVTDAGCTTHFCLTNSTAAFCADFDTTSNVDAGWNNPPLTSGGYTLSPNGEHWTSCPTSLQVSIPAPDGGPNPGSAWLSNVTTIINTQDGGLTFSHWDLDFDLFLGIQPSGGQTFTLAHFRVPVITGENIGIVYSMGQWQLQVGSNLASILPPTGKWTHVRIDVKYAGTTNDYVGTITIDSQVQGSTSVTGAQPVSPPTAEVYIGVGTQTNAPPGQIFYDNVLLTLQP